jgi:hypothetical protein
MAHAIFSDVIWKHAQEFEREFSKNADTGFLDGFTYSATSASGPAHVLMLFIGSLANDGIDSLQLFHL